MRTSCGVAVIVAVLGSGPAVHAQTPAGGSASQPAGGDADLAKQLSNPVASLVSVPLQPFVSYTTSTAVTFGLNLEASANWEAVDDDEWTVPLHLTVTKLTRFGSFPMSVGGGVGIFTAAPGGRPDWRLRFVATLLLPRK